MRITKADFTSISVWIVRLVTGAAFIFSGFAKGVDPWGTIFKLEQYLQVWGWAQPRSLLLIFTLLLCASEFLLGIFLLIGMYRRSAPRLALILILFFLFLTGYIVLFSPVDDCGCFGDALKLSNWATFIKNIILTGLIVFLVVNNARVQGLLGSLMQWIVLVVSLLYIAVVSITGYMIQPLVDFRPFPEGTSILKTDDIKSVKLIYEKDGEQQIFDADNLPSSDTGWKYVGRQTEESTDNPVIIENKEGEDVTEEVLHSDGDILLILIPELKYADISSTMYLNRITSIANDDGIEVVALVGSVNPDAIDRWKDISMASYPVYLADGIQLKTIARGEISLVYISDGIIRQKMSMSMISNGRIQKLEKGEITVEQTIGFNQHEWLKWLTRLYIAFILVIILVSLPYTYHLMSVFRKDRPVVDINNSDEK